MSNTREMKTIRKIYVSYCLRITRLIIAVYSEIESLVMYYLLNIIRILYFKLVMHNRNNQIEHAMICFAKTYPEYQQQAISIQKFSDGWIFYKILRSAEHFKIIHTDLIQKAESWTHKLSNLKKIVQKIQQYFTDQIHKAIKTKDVDLMQIAKNSNLSQMAKFFQLIVAVLTQAPNKQEHINAIMGLDQLSQSAFVQIIQSVLQNRVFGETDKKTDLVHLEQVDIENHTLKQQIQQLLKANFQLEKQLTELKQNAAQHQYQQPQSNSYYSSVQYNEQLKQKQRLKVMIENLKQKLVYVSRQYEQKFVVYKEEIHSLQHKLSRFDEIQYQLQEYKSRYSESIQSVKKAKSWERERIKLNRIIQEKQTQMKKIQQRIDQVNQKNFSLEEKQFYLKMQLQKRDVRFKQLEKQVKKRYEDSIPKSISDNSSITNTSHPNIASSHNINTHNLSYEVDNQQLQELRIQVQKHKKKARQTDRENVKLRRQVDRVSAIQAQKKKLEKLIVDVNQDKLDQIELLLETVYSLNMENIALNKIVKQNNISVK